MPNTPCVGMAGMMETAQAAADYMREELGLRVGVVHVTCFAPFPATPTRRGAQEREGDDP